MNMDALEGGILYADAAYNDYSLEEQLGEQGLCLMAARQSNSKRPWPEQIEKLITKRRKGIETCFSRIVRSFPRKIHAIRLSGLILKLTLFFVAFNSYMAYSIQPTS